MKQLTQKEKILNALRVRPQTVRDLFAYSNSPQKVVEGLRKDGYCIKTVPIKGTSWSEYVLNETPKPIITQDNGQTGLFDVSKHY